MKETRGAPYERLRFLHCVPWSVYSPRVFFCCCCFCSEFDYERPSTRSSTCRYFCLARPHTVRFPEWPYWGHFEHETCYRLHQRGSARRIRSCRQWDSFGLFDVVQNTGMLPETGRVLIETSCALPFGEDCNFVVVSRAVPVLIIFPLLEVSETSLVDPRDAGAGRFPDTCPVAATRAWGPPLPRGLGEDRKQRGILCVPSPGSHHQSSNLFLPVHIC